VDVIGIVKECEEITKVTSRTTQKQIPKRDITLMDMSGRTIRLTLWNQQAEKFNGLHQPVVAIKGAKISDFSGISLSTTTSSVISMNPDIPESHQLRGWYDSIGMNLHHFSTMTSSTTNTHTSLSSTGTTYSGSITDDDYKTLAQIKDENLGFGEKPSYFTTKATVTVLRHDTSFAYASCPTPNCNKKVNEMGVNRFYCEKCQKEYPKCDHRYILNIGFTDHTNTSWLSCFNDIGTLIMGHTADELMQWKQNGDMEKFLACFNMALYKTFHLKVRAKQESYQGEMKVRCHVTSATPVDYVKGSESLITGIRKQSTA
jgi:replication factor A1